MTDFGIIKERRSGHFIALDSLRGVCAIIVVLFHIEGSPSVFKTSFIEHGWVMVDFFFVLSGFVICANYGRKISSGPTSLRFMFLRLGRLYPLHIFILIAYLGVAISKSGMGMTGHDYSGAGFVLNLCLSQIWGAPGSWNSVSWSISAEFWIYGLFALICVLGGRFYSWVAALLIVACIPIIVTCSDGKYLAVTESFGALSRCIFGFSFGVIAFNLWSSRAGELLRQACDQWISATLIESVVVATCIALVSFVTLRPISLLCPPLFALTVLIFAAERGAISSVLLTKPMVFLGLLSYSIYMVHDFVIARFINVVQLLSKYFALPVFQHPTQQFALVNAPGWTWGIELATTAVLAAVIFVSYLTYKYIEDPFRGWSKQFVAMRLGSTKPV